MISLTISSSTSLILMRVATQRLTTWYAQGQSDAIGDRLLMFDNTNLPSWEILRFRQALAHNPTFEAAVRQRVEQLLGFHHDVPTRPSDQASRARRRAGGGPPTRRARRSRRR